MKHTTRATTRAVVSAAAVATATAGLVTGLGTSAPAATGFSTATTWAWAFATMPSTTSVDQRVTATVSGLTDKDKNAAVVLRRSSTADVVVNLSGTRYQVWTRRSGVWTNQVDKARPYDAAGTFAVALTGTTLRATLDGVLVDSRSVAATSTLTGTGTAAAIWQNVEYAVSVGSFSATNAGTTPPATPTPTPTTPKPTPTTPTPPPTTPPPPTPASTGFVTRSGTSLSLDGRPWRFVGFNAVHMLGCSTSDRVVSDIEGYFAGPGKGMTDRVWALPGSDLAKVDRIVKAAQANGSHVYFTLSDDNGACGDPGGAKTSAWYNGGWRATHEAWFRTMATRYRNSTAVAFWELVNESAGDGNAVKAFNTAAASLLKSIDPNHLVGSGTMPDYAFGGPAGWTAANSAAGVDITSVHEYDEDQVASSWLLADVKLSAALGKPIVVGEFGIEASQSGAGTRPLHGGACRFTYSTRASRAKAKLDAYLSTPGVVGADYWAFSNKSRTGSDCDTELGWNDTQLQQVFKDKAAALR